VKRENISGVSTPYLKDIILLFYCNPRSDVLELDDMSTKFLNFGYLNVGNLLGYAADYGIIQSRYFEKINY